MGDLATLPVFLKLAGKTVLVVGGSGGTAWKAELIAAAGAQVRLVWDEPDHETLALMADWPDRVTLHRRDWRDDDLAGVAIAIGAIEEEEPGQRFAAAARAAGVPVNVVDRPHLCDFQFGAIVNRSPLVIGISTDGGAPPLGQAIRSLIEALLPAGLAAWAKAAKAWRPRVMQAGLAAAERKAFWRRFAAEAMRRPTETPCPVEREAMLARFSPGAEASAEAGAEAGRTGHLALVGAGPGDPELLTMKAVRLLREADVVLHDDLVDPAVLGFARREARKIAVGKRGGQASCAQGDITRLAVLLASEGQRVVRLKGGDPLLFGRADEELAAAAQAGVPVTLVNGVSAAFGAAAALQTSLTRRGVARRVQFVTATDANGALPETLHAASLADPDATTVVYMGRAGLSGFTARVLADGLDPDTPAAFVINASRADQTLLRGTLGALPAQVAACEVEGPGVLLIGRCLASDPLEASQTWRLAAE
jgi:uroporphyrin-III C-methyltransferase/precorrin-2 dehydrogenase/sirohydrochlorin ferrochelatase